MCIFTSDKDIPGHVRLSTRTLQYLIIPMLSLALVSVGELLFWIVRVFSFILKQVFSMFNSTMESINIKETFKGKIFLNSIFNVFTEK